MFRRLFSALDRLVAGINAVAERFEQADRELADRIQNGRPTPVEDDTAATKELPPAPSDAEKTDAATNGTGRTRKPRQGV